MLPKPHRITSKAAIGKARKDYCELCDRRGFVHVHHIKSKGSGGNDEADNLVSLCPFAMTRYIGG